MFTIKASRGRFLNFRKDRLLFSYLKEQEVKYNTVFYK